MARARPLGGTAEIVGSRALRPWGGGLFLGLAVALVPWTVWLFVSLPSRHLSAHWDLAWGGFDVMLVASLAATAVTALRRSPWLVGFACATAALLVVDAWFDVTTAIGRVAIAVAIVEAVLVEVPLAIVCVFLARQASRHATPGRG